MWTTVSESRFQWERDALEFIRQRFPPHEPHRAWSNFEFIADDGNINEVDLLLFTPQGLFLVEIKSRPGRLFGDAGTWTWESDGRLSTVDNPLIAANLKAKKLRWGGRLRVPDALESSGQLVAIVAAIHVPLFVERARQTMDSAAPHRCLHGEAENALSVSISTRRRM